MKENRSDFECNKISCMRERECVWEREREKAGENQDENQSRDKQEKGETRADGRNSREISLNSHYVHVNCS